ncbi:MAG: adenylyl-sulfate kinase [Pseudohongiella sp.]|nr:adenylyl-sulfate kinase [Pseudohongiella sp.]MDP2126116.1 adenylyl-sulfate kinase [Pseudohongiella sp.]
MQDNQKQSFPPVIWLTGLSGAGKSTIARLLEVELEGTGTRCCVLDGDAVRKGLSSDLGFSDSDRAENIRRVAEVARLMSDSGTTVIVALISPFQNERARAREIIGADRFLEIFIDAPLSVAEGRDVKGLYKKARSGLLKQFTGIDSPYEAPLTPALRVYTDKELPEESLAKVLALLGR